MAKKVIDKDNYALADGVTKQEFDDLKTEVENLNPTITVTEQTVQTDNGKIRIYCKKMASLVVLWFELTNRTIATGKSQIGSNGIIPADYRPNMRMTSEQCRPVRINDSTITNTTTVVFEITTEGSVYVFTNEGLGDGWIVQGSIVFILPNS